jgi:DNA polymerase
MRFLAKARVLGLGFGVAAGKFQIVAKMLAGLDITLQQAQETVESYRRNSPKIVALWKKLERALKISTDPNDRTLVIPLPSGRELTYRQIKRHNGEITGLLPRLGKMMEVKLWHGLLAENATQAFARDVFMDRCMALEDVGYEILLRVHDEVVLLVDESDAQAHRTAVEKIMSTPPSWCSDLPLGAEAIISKQYTK